MRFAFLGLLALCILASANSMKHPFKDGTEYVYDSEIKIDARTMDYAPHAAAGLVQLKVRIQATNGGQTLNVEMSDLKVSEYVGSLENDGMESVNYHPFPAPAAQFTVNLNADGSFKSLGLSGNPNTFMKNMIKSWAAKFQMSCEKIKEGINGFVAEEQTIHGPCKVTYSVTPHAIHKTIVHNEDCDYKTRSFKVFDDMGGFFCTHKPPTTEGINSREHTYYKLKTSGDDVTITEIQHHEVFLSQHFETEGVSHLIHNNITMTLVEEKPSSGDISGGGDTVSSLANEFGDEKFKWNVDRDLKEMEPFFSGTKYLESTPEEFKLAIKKGLQNQIDLKDKHDPNEDTVKSLHLSGINSLYSAMYGMGYDDLMSLVDELKADKSEDGVFKFNVFTELLSSTGTTASVMVIKDMIKDKKFDNNRDAARALSGYAFHIRKPNKQLVKEMEELMTHKADLIRGAAKLSFGLLIRKTCERAGPPHSDDTHQCYKELAADYIKKFADKVKDPGTARPKKRKYLAILSNIRFGGVFENLKDLITDTSVESEIRTTAMWAASWDMLTHQQGREILLPIFANCHEDHEVRISAVSLFMYSHPSPADLAQISGVVATDKDYHLINYVFTMFEKFANSVDPCHLHVKEMSANFLKYMKQFSNFEASYQFGVSKTRNREYFNKKYGYGGNYEYYVVGSERSATPISLGMSITSVAMHSYKIILLSVHLRIEGLAKKLVRKFKTMDPETWKTTDLSNLLHGEMNIREHEDQPVRVAITVMFKGTVVVERSYDDSTDGKDVLGKIIEKMASLGDDYSINHQRVLQLISAHFEFPTASGIPGAALMSTTYLFTLRANVKRGNQRGLLFRDLDYHMHLFRQSSKLLMFRLFRKSYGVAHDIVHHMHVPRHLIIGVNPIRKELKIQFDRPTHDHPRFAIMHSVNFVAIRGNTIQGDVSDLQKYCPTCKKRVVVVSKGPEFIKSRHILEKDNEKRGLHLHVKYFLCEYDISRRNTIGGLIGVFTPYNKNENTIPNIFIMGMRQIRAFLTNFPRAEQCGIHYDFSQSDDHGVRDIEIVVRVTTDSNGEKMFYTGRKWQVRSVIKLKGDETRAHKLSVAYEGTPNKQENKFKFQYQRAEVAALGIKPYAFCMALENKYPPMASEMFGVEHSIQKLVGRVMLQYGFGANCGDGDGEIRIKYEMATTEETMKDVKNKWYYKQCMEEKNRPAYSAMAADKIPHTEACMIMLYDTSSARDYKFMFDFVKVSDKARAILSKVKTAIKAGLMPYYDIDLDSIDADGDELGAFINVDVKFHDDDKMMDAKITSSSGERTYEDHINKLQWSEWLKNLRFTGMQRLLFKMGLIKDCLVTVDSVKTMDNYTYSYEASDCWTLQSGHCSSTPTYSVFTKKSGGTKPLSLKTYIGGHEIEIDANSDSVTIDKSPVSLSGDDAHKHNINNVEIFKIFKWGSTYNIYSSMNVWISFDGTFVQTVPAPSVRGEHCGMCGNFNLLKHDEMTGKDGEKVSTAAEMANQWKWACP